ncbi:MAG: (deoxy)nucleoside triphosphate pyrophosphohydrolase [Desulfococcaceae bacterium]
MAQPSPSKPNPMHVTAAVIFQDGKVLVARRAPGFRHAGGWEFPGGKIEPGESPESCLARELAEEFGIAARVGRLVARSDYAYDFATVRIHAYEVEWTSGEMVPRDHDAVAWVRPKELLTVDLLPADLPIARRIVEMAGTGRNAI